MRPFCSPFFVLDTSRGGLLGVDRPTLMRKAYAVGWHPAKHFPIARRQPFVPSRGVTAVARFTVEDFYRMSDAGLLGRDHQRIELMEGESQTIPELTVLAEEILG